MPSTPGHLDSFLSRAAGHGVPGTMPGEAGSRSQETEKLGAQVNHGVAGFYGVPGSPT